MLIWVGDLKRSKNPMVTGTSCTILFALLDVGPVVSSSLEMVCGSDGGKGVVSREN